MHVLQFFHSLTHVIDIERIRLGLPNVYVSFLIANVFAERHAFRIAQIQEVLNRETGFCFPILNERA